MAKVEITVTLTKELVTEAIDLYLRQSGLKVVGVNYELVNISDCGYTSYAFTSATVNVEPANRDTTFSSLASQIASIENRATPKR